MSEPHAAPPAPRALELLRFWFGDTPARRQSASERWFIRNAEFDAEVRGGFGADVEQAGRGALDGWLATPHGALALVLLLDQLPRNIHRDSPLAFAHDAKALACTRAALARRHDRQLSLVERWFLAMPYMHAEDLAAQDEGLAYFRALAQEARGGEFAAALEGVLDYALRHRDVIERFGRFPHRNGVLGRDSTAAETAWLVEHPGGF